MLDRRAIIESLKSRLPDHAALRAAWLGGSDANARTDELSDIDLFLIVLPGQVEAAVSAVEREIEALSPIRMKLRLPMPTWHGFHQAFYQLENAPEYLMIDWLMIEQGQKHPWLEVERHGTPVVLFDRDAYIRASHADRAALDAAARKKLEDVRARFAMFRHIPPKLARRALPVDAIYFYHALILRPLVDALRATHCPDRHDFGFRYLRDDLPPELYLKLVPLRYPRSVDEIPALTATATELLESVFRDQPAPRRA